MYKYAAIFFVVFFVLILVISPLWLHAQTQKLRIVVESANLHMEPDWGSQVIRVIPLGTILELEVKEDDWYRIKLPPDRNGYVTSGYIHSQYTEILVEEATVHSQPAVPPPPNKRPVPVYSEPQYQARGVTKPQKAFHVKLMGGMGLANLTISDISIGGQDVLESAKQNQSGILGGIGLSFGRTLGIEVDALYMRKGAGFADETTIGGVPVEFNSNLYIDQLSIPILIKFKLASGSSPFLLAGGEVGMVLNAKFGYTLTSDNISQSDEADVKEDLKSMDYGVVFGAGYEANLGGFSVGLEGRYHLGIQNILDTSEDPESDEYVKTSVALAAGFIKF